MSRRRESAVFWSVTAIGVASIAALVSGFFQFGAQSDLQAKLREENVVANGLVARTREIEETTAGELIWDDAVKHLDNRFDPVWARDNVGQFFSAAGKFQFAAVLDHEGRVVYGMKDGEDVGGTTMEPAAAAAQTLVARVRAAETERGKLPQPLPQGYSLHHPIQASAPMELSDGLYLVTATLVQPDFGHAKILHDRAPVVLTGRAIDWNFLSALSERYLLRNIHLHPDDERGDPTEAHAPVRDADGAIIATLDWTPQRPGTRLLQAIMPWMLFLVGLLLAATLALYALVRRHANRLTQSESRSRHMAFHDALTGIPNRAQFERRLAERIVVRSDGDFAVHCIDLDRFKEVNDTHGHAVGDELLRIAASRICEAVGADGFCARLGGDEFAIIQEMKTPEEASALAERVFGALGEPYVLSIGPKRLSASIGAVVSEGVAVEPLEMLRRADVALYAAKAAGRNCFRLYDLALDEATKATRRLKEDLQADLAASKLSVVYQPQVRMSGEVVGLEALVRWRHEQLGSIPPSVFVPIAEEAGLIDALGEFVLREAARESLNWPDLKIAVNVSATQLGDPNFPDKVLAIVAEAGVECSRIELELTESVFFSDEERTKEMLSKLRASGFSIALDDFGTGYSSLSYLHRFPIDKVKIDRAFVNALGTENKADAVFAAIVHLAKALEMRVIAEGVETQEQWLRLHFAGCTEIQGFIASKPLSAADLAEFLDAKAPSGARSRPGLAQAG